MVPNRLCLSFLLQDCFKKNYNQHKQVHALAKQIIDSQGYVAKMEYRNSTDDSFHLRNER